MIKFHICAEIVCALALGAAPAVLASPIVYEPFNYASGSPNGQSPDSGGHTWGAVNTGSDSATITSGNLSVPSPLTAPANSNSLLYGGTGKTYFMPTGSVSSGSLYYSYALKITSLGNISTSQIISGFTNAPNSTADTTNKNPTNIGATLEAEPTDGTKTAYYLGFGTVNSAPVFNTTTSYSVTSPVTLFVVAQYNFNSSNATAQANLWVYNPASTLPNSPGTPTIPGNVGGGANFSPVTSFIYYENGTVSSNAFGSHGIQADELRVGTSWADVTGTPEPGSVSLIALSAASLLRRRRAR